MKRCHSWINKLGIYLVCCRLALRMASGRELGIIIKEKKELEKSLSFLKELPYLGEKNPNKLAGIAKAAKFYYRSQNVKNIGWVDMHLPGPAAPGRKK